MSNLHQKLGGAKGIGQIIDKYFDYMLGDANFNHFFKNTNMEVRKNKYKQFFARSSEGVQTSQIGNMKKIHLKYPISKKYFDDAWNHMQKAMKDLKIEEPLINQMKKLFYKYQNDIVKVQKEKEKPLFERIGGQAGVNVVVDKFYEFMLQDPLTSPSFSNTDMKELRNRQKQYIRMITGGPNKYEGVDIKTAHKSFKKGTHNFDQAWHNFEKALNLYNVNQVEINELKHLLYSVEKEKDSLQK